MKQAAESGQVEKALRALAPQHPQYERLRQTLARYREIAAARRLADGALDHVAEVTGRAGPRWRPCARAWRPPATWRTGAGSRRLAVSARGGVHRGVRRCGPRGPRGLRGCATA